ncbi:MAG: type II toxin-antitoxin system ParD family antitoxin [Acidobacteriota bacterium]|nr:type II toxin-antitoxin system ParD family antitoxin [Acidobacteriota bacterium]
MNVSLTSELEAFVASKVRSGRYHSASEVIREALRLLEEREQLKALRIRALREKIGEGLEQLDHGEGIAGELIFSELEAELGILEQTRHED